MKYIQSRERWWHYHSLFAMIFLDVENWTMMEMQMEEYDNSFWVLTKWKNVSFFPKYNFSFNSNELFTSVISVFLYESHFLKIYWRLWLKLQEGRLLNFHHFISIWNERCLLRKHSIVRSIKISPRHTVCQEIKFCSKNQNCD